MASGVTSRTAGPVSAGRHNQAAPVLITQVNQRRLNHRMLVRNDAGHWLPGEVSTSRKYSRIAGPPRSSYSPRLARSETVTMPIRASLDGGTHGEDLIRDGCIGVRSHVRTLQNLPFLRVWRLDYHSGLFRRVSHAGERRNGFPPVLHSGLRVSWHHVNPQPFGQASRSRSCRGD